MTSSVTGESTSINTYVKESARNLKKLGVAIEVISQATGLSKEEIEIL